jgi:hypothetical protein
MPKIAKLKHWDTRGFHQFLHTAARAAKPFAWGTHDCCTFVADAVQSVTGVDIAGDFRGLYHDEAGAFAIVKRLTGGSTVADAMAYCAARHGLWENKHPLMTGRGEMVAVRNGGTIIAGIVHLNGRHVVSLSESGPVRLPIRNVIRGWSYE